MLNHRQFGGGLAVLAGTMCSAAPALSQSPGIAPLPAHALACCNEMVQGNAVRLEAMAQEVWRIEPLIGTDRGAAERWCRLFEDMTYEAWGLREKGIGGRSPPERELLDWVCSISPDDETAARMPRTQLQGLSPEYKRHHEELESHLFELACNAPAVNSANREEALRADARQIIARSNATTAAWAVVSLVPENRIDAEAHRLAVEVLHRPSFVFEQRYSV